jgi:predicted RNA binding protein YcfA (HicA-like mRNA interferase family)
MPKLNRIFGEEAIRNLKRLSFQQVRQRGSHVVLKKKHPKEMSVVLFLYIKN